MSSSSGVDSTTAPLAGKLALITGCTGGIGRATALRFGRLGCSVAVHYNTSASVAHKIVDELTSLGPGVRAAAFQADLSTYANVRALHEAVVATLGHPDILFNNAGAGGKVIGPFGRIEDISPELFEETWRLNTGSHFLLTQLCIPHMAAQKYGRVVFNSSIAAGTGGVIGPHYASSKSAIHGLLHWIATSYTKDGLTCNAVAPAAIIETAMLANPTEEIRALIPVGRFGKPDEVASVVELLVTNAYLTNKIFAVDGGWTPSPF
ncbi:hypothetical protein M0805_005658 [Coniferiporia weirii]|nr:hypothetical protein M0805_005658 [Coniferiporia weirii]